jgi:hypothetical protein
MAEAKMVSRHLANDSVNAAPHEAYLLHKIPYKISLPKKSQTQVAFTKKLKLQTRQIFRARASHPLYFQGSSQRAVMFWICIEKTPQTLASGLLRAYSTQEKTPILLGETEITQTPKGEKLELSLGSASEIVMQEELLEQEHTKEHQRSKIRYKILNASDKNRDIELEIPFTKEPTASITTKEPYHFTKGNLATFSLHLAAGASKEFEVNFKK